MKNSGLLFSAILSLGISFSVATAAPQTKRCTTGKFVGLREVTAQDGTTGTVWYPTTTRPKTFRYKGGLKSQLAVNAPAEKCIDHPVIIFSHGYKGCPAQTVFLMEALAKAGYIVAAPKHTDALCTSSPATIEEPSFKDPELWDHTSFEYRKTQINSFLDLILTDTRFRADKTKVGISGHSLGGYSALASIGGWDEWKDSRFKAALAMSPYLEPFLLSQTLGSLSAPVMYQGGTIDFSITDKLKGSEGAFAKTPDPKFYVELKNATHFAWTNIACGTSKTVQQCLTKENPKKIVSYGLTFFNAYVKESEKAKKALLDLNLVPTESSPFPRPGFPRLGN